VSSQDSIPSRESWLTLRRRGTIQEIAGNDDVMVTITVPQDSAARVRHTHVFDYFVEPGTSK